MAISSHKPVWEKQKLCSKTAPGMIREDSAKPAEMEQWHRGFLSPGTRKTLVQSLVTLSDLGMMHAWNLNPTDFKPLPTILGLSL